MTDEITDHLREKDHAVLTAINRGATDTRQIREATTLSNRDVNYCLDKLDDLGLIETETQDGRVTRVVDGQKRNFKAPRQARLTDRGVTYLTSTDKDQTRYDGMTHDDVVEQVYNLEQRVEELEAAFEAFRQQVLQKLD